jgi:hypothetical protein
MRRRIISLFFVAVVTMVGLPIALATSASAALSTSNAITSGKPVHGVVSSPGGVSYTFGAVNNAHVTLAITKPVTTPAGSCLQMNTYDASNALDVGPAEFNTAPTDINFTPNATQAGTTKVVITPDGYECTAATSATFTLTYAKDVSGKLTSGKAEKVDLKFEGQNADFTFTAVAGKHVTLAITHPLTSPADSCLQVNVYDRSGADYAGPAEFSVSPTDLNFTPDADEAGLATVTISADGYECSGAVSGTFDFTYATDVTGSLTSGKAKPVDLKFEGQDADFTFTAVAGKHVTLAITHPLTSPADSCLQMSVYDRSGADYAGPAEFSTGPVTLSFTPSAAEVGVTNVIISADGYECAPATSATFDLTYKAG